MVPRRPEEAGFGRGGRAHAGGGFSHCSAEDQGGSSGAMAEQERFTVLKAAPHYPLSNGPLMDRRGPAAFKQNKEALTRVHPFRADRENETQKRKRVPQGHDNGPQSFSQTAWNKEPATKMTDPLITPKLRVLFFNHKRGFGAR